MKTLILLICILLAAIAEASQLSGVLAEMPDPSNEQILVIPYSDHKVTQQEIDLAKTCMMLFGDVRSPLFFDVKTGVVVGTTEQVDALKNMNMHQFVHDAIMEGYGKFYECPEPIKT